MSWFERTNPLEDFPSVSSHLDLGSGEGDAMRFMKRNPVCLEVNKLVAKLGHRKYGFTYVVGDAQHLPFRNASFSLVTGFEVIEHLEQPSRLMNEAHRVLSNNGVLVITTQNKRFMQFNHFSNIYEQWKRSVGHKHDGFYVSELKRLGLKFRRCGFTFGSRFWLYRLLWQIRMFVAKSRFIHKTLPYILLIRFSLFIDKFLKGEGLNLMGVYQK